MPRGKRPQRKAGDEQPDDSFSGEELPSRRVRRRLEEQEKEKEKSRNKRKPDTRRRPERNVGRNDDDDPIKLPNDASGKSNALALAKSLVNVDSRVLAHALKSAKEAEAKKKGRKDNVSPEAEDPSLSDENDAESTGIGCDEDIIDVEEPGDLMDGVSWKGVMEKARTSRMCASKRKTDLQGIVTLERSRDRKIVRNIQRI